MKSTFTILFLLLIMLVGCSTNDPIMEDTDDHPEEHEATGLSHAHGLVVDVLNPSRLLIPTHHGLYVFENDEHLELIGDNEDDFMAFAVHPENSQIMFHSGHENDHHDEGEFENLGVQKSTDGGLTWESIWHGGNEGIDFHAMQISPANPDLMYGWFKGELYISKNGGTSWNIVENDLYETLTFVPHPQDPEIAYAATSYGIMVSEDQGESWNFLSPELERTAVITLSIDPTDPTFMLSYSKKLGLAMSTDNGKTWTSLQEDFNGELALYITFDTTNTNIIYIITKPNSIYKSTDKGITWNKIL